MSYSEFVKDVLNYNNIPEKDWDKHLDQSGQFELSDLPVFSQEKEVCQLFESALLNQDAIMLSSDFDCDGVTGSVILYRYLKNAGFNVTPQTMYIPNRHEGYGMSATSIKKRHDEQDIKIIITVDCGISNHEEIAFAKKLGIKTVIVDHHTIGDTLPDAEFILHPGVHDELNEIIDFSGAGMAFYLCYMLEQRLQTRFDLEKWSSVAAIGIIGDMTKLIGKNRDFVKHGMANFETCDIAGIRALSEISKVSKFVDEDTFAYKIIPRLNAAGRMADPIWSFATLATDDYDQALKGADKLESLNVSRRELCADYIEQAKQLVNHDEPVILISSEQFKHGIVGITAANLVELYNKPAFVVANEGFRCKGSARTPAGFSTYDALHHAQSILEKWGGHKAASGFVCQEKNLEDLQILLNESYYMQTENKGIEDKKILSWKESYLEGELKPALKKLLSDIILMKPFGQGFKMPEFKIRTTIESISTNYPTRKHLFCKMLGIKAVGWSLFKEEYIDLTPDTEFDIIFTINATDYQRVNPYVRIQIIEMDIAQ